MAPLVIWGCNSAMVRIQNTSIIPVANLVNVPMRALVEMSLCTSSLLTMYDSEIGGRLTTGTFDGTTTGAVGANNGICATRVEDNHVHLHGCFVRGYANLKTPNGWGDDGLLELRHVCEAQSVVLVHETEHETEAIAGDRTGVGVGTAQGDPTPLETLLRLQVLPDRQGEAAIDAGDVQAHQHDLRPVDVLQHQGLGPEVVDLVPGGSRSGPGRAPTPRSGTGPQRSGSELPHVPGPVVTSLTISPRVPVRST